MVTNATGGDELTAELGETLKEEELLIGPTQRPNGTLRKPIPIRAGFVPQDQVPIYQSRDALEPVKRYERKGIKVQQAGLVKDEDSEKNDLLPADDWDDLPEAVEWGSSKMNELPLSGNASLVSSPSDSRDCSTPEKQLQDIDEHIRALEKKELENEIAEVLSDLNQPSRGPSSKKEDLREVNRSRSDTKSCVSSPISNSSSTNDPVLGPKSTPFSAVLPKRKRPRQVLENSSYGARSGPVSAKPEMVQIPKSEILSPNIEIIPGSVAENGYEIGGTTDISLEQPAPESVKLNLEFKPVVTEELQESRDLVAKEEVSSPEEKESHVVRTKEINSVESTSMVTASFAATLNKTNSMVSEVHNSREEKFEIDLMLPPPRGRSSHKRESKIDISTKTVDQTPILSVLDSELKLESRDKEYEKGMAFEEKKGEGTKEEAESEKGFVPQDELSIYQSRDALAVKNENSENDLPENVEAVSSKNELTSFGNASLVTSPSDSRECSTMEKQDELIRAVKKNLKKLTERRRMLEQLEKDAKLKGLRR